MGLNAFLKQSAVLPENERVAVSKRFVDENGEVEKWEIRAITADEENEIRKSCTRKVPVPGRKNQYTEETNQTMYLRKLAVACTVYPNLNDRELQDSYGVLGAEALLGAMLLPGEFADFLNAIAEVTGFEASLEEKVEEVKN